jgi:hypothetical protein
MTHQRKPSGRREGPGYQMADGIPWPTMADGQPYVLHGDGQPYRVQLQGREDQGVVQCVTWCHPDGEHMENRTKTLAATKTRPQRRKLNPGEWFGTVSWDDPDRPDRPPVKTRLTDLLPIPPGT